MKDVLFLFSANDVSFSLLPFLLKYKVNNKTTYLQKPYFVGDLDESAITGQFEFKYEDTNIDLFYAKNINYEYDSVINFVESNCRKAYDKIYVFIEWSSLNPKYVSNKNVEIVYYKADENYHIKDAEVKNILKDYKIISSASLSFQDKNFYFEPLINLFVFYYIFGFDYLSYTKLDIKKTNLLGMYYIKNYKIVRDEFYEKSLTPIFQKNNLDLPTIYDTQTDKPQLVSQLLQINKGFWGLNHNAMYTDYITSVCGFIFDTLNHKSIQGPSDGMERYYINEKALKGIMYSKLNIPFILDTNPNNFEILNNLGFWFLNSEFYEFNTNKPTEDRVNPMYNSIINAVEHLISIYKDNNSDLNKTHSALVEKYGDKMQNNYNTFIKYLTDAPNGDKLINFILYGNRN